MQQEKQPTNQEILRAINKFANQVVTKEEFKQKMSKLATKKNLERFATKADLAKFQTKMVTKDYLDNKLDKLKGYFVNLTRQEDTKLISLVKILGNGKVIKKQHSDYILSLKPFARIKH